MATVQEAQQALNEEKVVLAKFAGRDVTVNTLLQGTNGWVMTWSHSDYPEAHVDLLGDGDVEFIIRNKYARYK